MALAFGFNYQNVILIFFILSFLIFSGALLVRFLQFSNQLDKWLGILVLLFALYLMPWTLGSGGWYGHDNLRDLLFFIPFHQYFFYGPLILFLSRSLAQPNWRIEKKDYWHLVPGIFYLAYAAVIAIFDGFVFSEYYFYSDNMDKDFNPLYQSAGLTSLTVYALISFRVYMKYRTQLSHQTSYADDIRIKWLGLFLVGLAIIILLRAVATFTFPELGDWGFKWWFYLCFGALAYRLAISGYSHSHASQFTSFSVHSVFQPDDIYTKTDKQTSTSDLDEIKEIIQNEELYRDRFLTLPKLSRRLDINTSDLSALINGASGKNFNDFINEFRVKHAQSALENKEHEHKTLEGIAYEAGFNSRSTFLRAFKKFTNSTPSEYLEKH